jgi:chromosome segregation ATPase
MLGMTTHSENMTRVQNELWHFVNDEGARNVLETIIQKMKEAGNDSEHLKQLHNEALTPIPDNNQCDENYWVAAYILYFNTTAQTTIQELIKTNIEILSLEDETTTLEEKIEETEYEIEELESDLEHKEYKLSEIYYDMYYGCEESEEDENIEDLEEDDEDSEEDPEVLEIEIQELNDALGAMESNLGYLYYKFDNMVERLCELECKRKKLLENLKKIASEITIS